MRKIIIGGGLVSIFSKLVVLISFTSISAADTIMLKNGTMYQGVILAETTDIIKIKSNGLVLDVWKDSVDELVRDIEFLDDSSKDQQRYEIPSYSDDIQQEVQDVQKRIHSLKSKIDVIKEEAKENPKLLSDLKRKRRELRRNKNVEHDSYNNDSLGDSDQSLSSESKFKKRSVFGRLVDKVFRRSENDVELSEESIQSRYPEENITKELLTEKSMNKDQALEDQEYKAMLDEYKRQDDEKKERLTFAVQKAKEDLQYIDGQKSRSVINNIGNLKETKKEKVESDYDAFTIESNNETIDHLVKAYTTEENKSNSGKGDDGYQRHRIEVFDNDLDANDPKYKEFKRLFDRLDVYEEQLTNELNTYLVQFLKAKKEKLKENAKKAILKRIDAVKSFMSKIESIPYPPEAADFINIYLEHNESLITTELSVMDSIYDRKDAAKKVNQNMDDSFKLEAEAFDALASVADEYTLHEFPFIIRMRERIYEGLAGAMSKEVQSFLSVKKEVKFLKSENLRILEESKRLQYVVRQLQHDLVNHLTEIIEYQRNREKQRDQFRKYLYKDI